MELGEELGLERQAQDDMEQGVACMADMKQPVVPYQNQEGECRPNTPRDGEGVEGVCNKNAAPAADGAFCVLPILVDHLQMHTTSLITCGLATGLLHCNGSCALA